MFMIERSRDGDELKETFKVLGSTGNVCLHLIMKDLILKIYTGLYNNS